MKLEKIETPGLAHYAYLIADGGTAAIVDPSRDVGPYLEAARRLGVRIAYVIETHRHEDFVMGSTHLAQRTGAEVVNGRHELFGRGDRRLDDGESFALGGLEVRALHTPGHTPESMSYAVYDEADDEPSCVFTGDTLFFGDTGRSDLPDADDAEGNAARIYDSVHAKLADLGDGALVLPAHGPGSVCGSGMAERPFSTLGREKRANDVFTLERDAFAKKKGGEQLPRPPYFRRMEEVNLAGGLAPVAAKGVVGLYDPEAFAERCADGLVFDTREPEAFAGGHVAGSHSIWLGGLPVFGGWIGDESTPIHLVTDRGSDVDTAAAHLSRIGVDGVAGALRGGFGSWRRSGRPIARAGVTLPRELADAPGAFQVLDVRESGEFEKGHVPDALHCYVGHLEERLGELELDRERPVVVTCGVGHRAGLGVSVLLREGFADVRNLLGGMSAWNALGLPTRP